ncbi:MAG: 1,4-alpha-glucan branching protein GlgB [Lachnospiraceae bacterium]|nr:1,4-alpha-glucan branching protein GlgB [Lachnospiraceae bacterium]
MDIFGFYSGQEFEAYNYLGAHTIWQGGTVFRTYAPSAVSIELIGEFNDWQEAPMQRVGDGNFWELTVPEALEGMMYKYRIHYQDGRVIDHCDPYGFLAQVRPDTASVISTLRQEEFYDGDWMAKRSDMHQNPLNIYEMHMGSWQKPGEGQEDWYTYREVADRLVGYLLENRYNYVEVMPLCEHPSDESWGYQATGFFAPTARYGTPSDLRYFINKMHENYIGVILDFVPVHFACNDYALWQYDGTPLYEFPYDDVAYNQWGSRNFAHYRGDVRSFLQSSAYYWLKEFHFDGLRMDAISNIIYWHGNSDRGENITAVQFIKAMNQGLKQRLPACMLIAEDSSDYPKVTEPVEEGGLGFDYKWDLGWMNDTLDYFRADPGARSDLYHKLTFSMLYYYNEKFILPFSHDEVVHGKATILQKMNGWYDQKFPQARALYMYMYAHPGKKMNFMGNGFGHLREWDEKSELDWGIFTYPAHDAFHHFMVALNTVYEKNEAFWMLDYQREGFEWLDCHQESRCLYVFERRSRWQRILAVFNFSDQEQKDYRHEVPKAYGLRLLLDSDWERFGGTTREGSEEMTYPEKGEFSFTMPPFSARYYAVMVRFRNKKQ